MAVAHLEATWNTIFASVLHLCRQFDCQPVHSTRNGNRIGTLSSAKQLEHESNCYAALENIPVAASAEVPANVSFEQSNQSFLFRRQRTIESAFHVSNSIICFASSLFPGIFNAFTQSYITYQRLITKNSRIPFYRLALLSKSHPREIISSRIGFSPFEGTKTMFIHEQSTARNDSVHQPIFCCIFVCGFVCKYTHFTFLPRFSLPSSTCIRSKSCKKDLWQQIQSAMQNQTK